MIFVTKKIKMNNLLCSRVVFISVNFYRIDFYSTFLLNGTAPFEKKVAAKTIIAKVDR